MSVTRNRRTLEGCWKTVSKIFDLPGDKCSILHTLDSNPTTMISSESFSKDRILDFDNHFGSLCEGRGRFFLRVALGMRKITKTTKNIIYENI